MHAYAVQDAAGMVKLDAMENPFALSPELQASLGARLGAVAVNRYPGPRVEDLKAALARYRLTRRNDDERYIYFFDTPGLDLLRSGMIARARRVVGGAH